MAKRGLSEGVVVQDRLLAQTAAEPIAHACREDDNGIQGPVPDTMATL